MQETQNSENNFEKNSKVRGSDFKTYKASVIKIGRDWCKNRQINKWNTAESSKID